MIEVWGRSKCVKEILRMRKGEEALSATKLEEQHHIIELTDSQVYRVDFLTVPAQKI